MGYKLFATPGTSKFLTENGVKNELVHFPLTKKSPNISELLEKRKIDLVINIPKNYQAEELTNGYLIRRKAIDFEIPLIVNLQVAKLMVDALEVYGEGPACRQAGLDVREWGEYVE